LLHSPRIEGWRSAEKRSGAALSTRRARHLASKTRVNALMTRDARLSALHRGVSFLRSFPRKRESRYWVPAFAGTNGKRLTPRLAPHSGSSLEHALNERGCGCSSTTSIRSQ